MTEAEIFYQLFHVIGVMTVAVITCLILSGIGALAWILATIFGDSKQKPRPIPICVLTLKKCIHIEDDVACRDCHAYKNFVGEESKDESDGQDGPQR